MGFLIKKNRICLSILSLLVVIVFFLSGGIKLTSASTMPTTDSLVGLPDVNREDNNQSLPDPAPGWRALQSPLHNRHLQQNNQSSEATGNGATNISYQGTDQGNSGNQDTNQGYNQDNAGNSGNQVGGQGKDIPDQENNQTLRKGNEGATNVSFEGTNEGNSGNQGTNQGNNQDNAGNNGNQVNNQGTTIGTQINNQGTEVNNDGSTIKKQVNYMNLIPGLQFNLVPGHPVSVGIEKGWYLRVPLKLR